MSAQETRSVASRAREDIVRMTGAAGTAHVGSSLSCVDILAVLYGRIASVDYADPRGLHSDAVLVSKGHAAAACYAVLAQLGHIAPTELHTYCMDGAVLGGHVTSGHAPGILLSTGSLGHALPFAVGRSIAAMRAGYTSRAFVVLSDGECDEGSNWEAAMIAAHHELSRISVIIDRNGLQSLTETEQTTRLEPLIDKWRAFGWDTTEIDGHDHGILETELSIVSDRPRCIVAHTVKGRGVSFMEGQVVWHYRPPSPEQVEAAVREIRGQL